MTSVLALDVGTSSVRVQAFDEHGRPRGDAAKEKYTTSDPDEVVDLVRRSIGGKRNDVDAVGASCFGHSLLALDEHARPLTPILGWRDTRSADAATWLARRVDAAAIHARTGCHIHTSYWPAKLAWLAAREPDLFRRAHRFVSFADYLYMQLLRTDEITTSLSLASGTGLVDLRTRTWDPELLDTLGIDAERLPRIGDAPIDGWYPALLDGACSNIGAGCVTRDRGALMIGTSGAFRTVYETETPMPRTGLFLYRVDETRVVEGGALSDGGNLHFWLTEVLRSGDESLADRDPTSHGLTFVTLLGGERSPGWHQHARGVIHGLTFDTTALDIRQAALEGIGFRFADVLDLMPEVDEIVATGGALLRDPDWCQIMADALARPIVLSDVDEASLRGAAVVTLERLGESADEPSVGKTFEPRIERADEYRSARERQRVLYDVATGDDTS